MSEIERGVHRFDKERESVVLVLEVHDTPADEYKTGQYNWDKTELTVAGYEANSQYPSDDPVATGVYLESLAEHSDDPESLSPDDAEAIIEQERTVKSYTFPLSRLASTEEVEEAV